ncbi:MAG: NAD(P)/FAD-dependent oxidoreductase, partial [Phycisphaerae bacterium]|nr:NAD(P)/FAD-dependent oxidoreductase [Phycisphaerae bacterium]
DKWDIDFYPVERFKNEPRPGKYEGQRRFTAFQVDRSKYDTILLNHAASKGAEVRQPAKVAEVLVEGDRVTGLRMEGGETITARHYIDASGTVAVLRRALGIHVDVMRELRNVAFWDYWQNADWVVEIGVGGTRIQVRSLPYGWIWFIPLGPTRTSVGLVTPVEHYTSCGMAPEALYRKALAECADIAPLLKNATCEGKFTSCKDWSQLADRIIGENWFLVGEAAGFADPILSAGMSLAHSSARDAAYTIMELNRGEIDAAWLRERFNERHRTAISQHIRFGQFWYSANACFTDLKEHCQRIADDAGLRLEPIQAWRWLSQGGFANEIIGHPTFGSFDVASAKQILALFDPIGSVKTKYLASGFNEFKLNLRNTKHVKFGLLRNGRIEQVDCLERGIHRLPLTGLYGTMYDALKQTPDIRAIVDALKDATRRAEPGLPESMFNVRIFSYLQALETMIEEHWVTPSLNRKKAPLIITHAGSKHIRSSEEGRRAVEAAEDHPTVVWRI